MIYRSTSNETINITSAIKIIMKEVTLKISLLVYLKTPLIMVFSKTLTTLVFQRHLVQDFFPMNFFYLSLPWKHYCYL